MTISIQTQKRKFGREWLGNYKDQKARQGQLRFCCLFPHQCSFTVVIQTDSVYGRQQVCFSEGLGQARTTVIQSIASKLHPLYSL